MARTPSAMLLRDGLLEGVKVVLACAPEDQDAGFVAAVAGLCGDLGAQVARCEPSLEGSPEEREAATAAAVAGAVTRMEGASILVVDVAGIYERGPGPEGLAVSLQAAWDVTRALANQAFIPGSVGGRVLLLAPRSGGDDVHAPGAAAGLENLARTLSVEWARYGITIVAVAPGTETIAEEVASLCAWLASPAGSYFSGCQMDLRGPQARLN